MDDSIEIKVDLIAAGVEKGTEQLKAAIESIGKSSQEMGAKLNASVGGLGKGMQSILGSVKGLGGQVKNAIGVMGKGFQSVAGSAKKIVGSIIGVGSAYAVISKSVNAFMSQNQQLSGQMQACWTALGNAFGPIITQIINLVSTAISYVIKFMQLLGFTSKSASEVSKSAKGAGGALAKTVAGFDELNKLQESGGGGGGGGTLGDVDPTKVMEDLANAIASGDFFKVGEIIAGEFEKILGKVNQFFLDLDAKNFGEKFAQFINGLFNNPSLFTTAGETVANGLNFVLHFFDQLINGTNWGTIGANLAAGVNKMFSTIDWGSLGTLISGCLNGLADFFYNFAKDLDVLAIANDLTTTINTAIDTTNWEQIGAAALLCLLDLVEGVAEFFRTLDWAGLIRGLFDIIVGFIEEIMSDPTRIIMAVLRLLAALKNVICGVLVGMIAGILDLLGTFIPGLSEIADGMTAEFDKMVDEQTADLDRLEAEIRASLGGASEAVDDATESMSHLSDATAAHSGHAGKLNDTTEKSNSLFAEQRAELEAVANSSNAATNAMYQLEGGATAMNNSVDKIDTKKASNKFNALEQDAVNAGERGSSAFALYSDPLSAAGLAANSTAEEINATSDATDKLAKSLEEVKNKATEVGEGAQKSFQSFADQLSTAKDNVGSITTALNGLIPAAHSVAQALGSVVTQLVNIFNTNWQLPKLILPHIQVQWESADWMRYFFGVSAMPNLYIQWYKKGGIVDGATLIGAGEDGKEAIIPLERNTEWINMVAEGLIERLEASDYKIGGTVAMLKDIADEVKYQTPAVASGTVVPYSVAAGGGYSSTASGEEQILELLGNLYEAVGELREDMKTMQFVAQFDNLRALAKRITQEQKRQTISEGR